MTSAAKSVLTLVVDHQKKTPSTSRKNKARRRKKTTVPNNLKGLLSELGQLSGQLVRVADPNLAEDLGIRIVIDPNLLASVSVRGFRNALARHVHTLQKRLPHAAEILEDEEASFPAHTSKAIPGTERVNDEGKSNYIKVHLEKEGPRVMFQCSHVTFPEGGSSVETPIGPRVPI